MQSVGARHVERRSTVGLTRLAGRATVGAVGVAMAVLLLPSLGPPEPLSC